MALGDDALAACEQCPGNSASARAFGDVDLLDLVVLHDHEAHDGRPDGRHRGRLEAWRDPLAEVLQRAVWKQRRRDVSEVAVTPARVPHLSDRVEVARRRAS
ncbi:MAG TPA: hypothetical protein VKA96_04035 [Solirubrobacteraceae bacterium]|nr:hypothetical protein [Solirubrobacteraceae bacterium]